jgi:hypothetical protein
MAKTLVNLSKGEKQEKNADIGLVLMTLTSNAKKL